MDISVYKLKLKLISLNFCFETHCTNHPYVCKWAAGLLWPHASTEGCCKREHSSSFLYSHFSICDNSRIVFKIVFGYDKYYTRGDKLLGQHDAEITELIGEKLSSREIIKSIQPSNNY